MFRKEINILLTAVMFYTRIPVPKIRDYSDEMLNKATRYFPFIGIVIGGVGALVFRGLEFILPIHLSIILSMAATIFITGAFHEDGFADFCDGFGGGYTPDRILEIMKDSRIGTYGTIGLVLMLATKFFSLSSMLVTEIPILLICGHAFSRFLPVCLIYTSSYVRQDALSKAKPIGHKGGIISFLAATIFGLTGLIFIPWKAIVIISLLSIFLFIFYRLYTQRKIGGYTGDVLGGLQQLAEITFYLGFLLSKQICL